MTKPNETVLDVVAWLRDAMDAAQRDTEAATPGPWAPKTEDPGDDEVYTQHDGEHGDLVGDVVAYVRGGYGKDPADHVANMHLIATHADPTAVLRRIAADRKLLELHQPVPGWPDECTTCLSDRGSWPETWSGDTYPCQTVRLLAEAWGWTDETA